MTVVQIALVAVAGLAALAVLASVAGKSGFFSLFQRSPTEPPKGGDPARKAANDDYFALLEFARVNAPESVPCLVSFHQHFASAGLKPKPEVKP